MPSYAPPDLGFFWLRSIEPKYFFEASFYGDAPGTTSDSYQGWQVVGVPQRLGLTEWGGRNPVGLDMDFMIDRYSHEEGEGPVVHAMRDTLEKMAATGSRVDAPPIIIFDSGGLCQHDYTRAPHVRWIIENLNFDRTQTIISDGSNPLRVVGSMTLRQYNHDDILDSYGGPADKAKGKKNKPKPTKKSKGHATFVQVRANQNLQQLAADVLGDAAKWRSIADLNGIRDPRGIKAGQQLRIP